MLFLSKEAYKKHTAQYLQPNDDALEQVLKKLEGARTRTSIHTQISSHVLRKRLA